MWVIRTGSGRIDTITGHYNIEIIASIRRVSYLKNIAATSGSRGPRRRFQPIVRRRLRPAINELPKGVAKFIA